MLLDLQCANLQVPRDHARPASGTLPVAVARIRSAHQHDRIGSLVLNPGGPGGSGLDALQSWAAWFPEGLLDRFDIVSFDPRGVGESAPLSCPAPPDRDSRPLESILDERAVQDHQTRAGQQVRACAQAMAATGASYGTDAVARDLDLLRTGLGDDRLTYVGWSYGARLGAHYAHLFPDRVRALVLDSPPHPTAPWAQLVEGVTRGFEATFTAYDTGCPSRDTCRLLNGSPRIVLDRVVRTAREQPIRSGRPSGDPPATWNVILQSVLVHLPAPELWPSLDQALAEADNGDSGSLYDMIDAATGRTPTHPDRDSTDIQRIIQCTDAAPMPDSPALRRAATRLARQHPSLGPYTAWFLFACTPWAAARTPLPPPTTSTNSPILTIGGVADPSTPIEGARALADILGRPATLLISAKPGHTSFGRSPCIDRHVSRLLITLQPPPASTVCP